MRKIALIAALALAPGLAFAQGAPLSPVEQMDLRRAEDLRRQALTLEGQALRLEEQQAREQWMHQRALEADRQQQIRQAAQLDQQMREAEARHNRAIQEEAERQRLRTLQLRGPNLTPLTAR